MGGPGDVPLAKRTSDEARAEDEKPPKQRFRFCGPQKPKPTKIPKVAKLLAGGPPTAFPPPPQAVVDKLWPCSLIAAIDIDTHSLVYGNTKSWRRGQFGFLTTVEKDNLSSLRIVRIGWAIDDASHEHPVVHDRVVIPDGFEITAEATEKHRISHELATSTGQSLRDALRSMMDDVLGCCARGGRLVAHHLAFHAGIISEELGRSGLAHLKERWATAVRDGICTMNPDIACWARSMMGIYEIPRSIPTRLSDMVKGLIGG